MEHANLEDRRIIKLALVVDITDYSSQQIVSKQKFETDRKNSLVSEYQAVLVNNGFKVTNFNSQEYRDKKIADYIDNKIKEYIALCQHRDILNCEFVFFIYLKGIGLVVPDLKKGTFCYEYIDNKGMRYPIQQVVEGLSTIPAISFVIMDCPWEIQKGFNPVESKMLKGTPGKPPVGFSCIKYAAQPDPDTPTN